MEEVNQEKQFIGRIYKLVSENTEKMYIGSTTQTIKRRYQKHIVNYNLWKENKYHYITAFDIIKCEKARIELIIEKEYGSVLEIHNDERFYIEQNINRVVNIMVPTRTKEEYRKEKDRKSTRLNSSHTDISRMPSSA